MKRNFLTLTSSKQTQLCFRHTNASLKNLEVQIGQQVQAVQKNPEDCIAVILISEKKDIEEEKQAKIGEELEQHSSGTTEKKKTTLM